MWTTFCFINFFFFIQKFFFLFKVYFKLWGIFNTKFNLQSNFMICEKLYCLKASWPHYRSSPWSNNTTSDISLVHGIDTATQSVHKQTVRLTAPRLLQIFILNFFFHNFSLFVCVYIYLLSICPSLEFGGTHQQQVV